jgi:DNA polymerase-3 subunit delta
MPEISFTSLEKQIKQISSDSFVHACLIYGEEFLYKNALNMIIDSLIPGNTRDLHYEPIDGTNENIPRALEQVNTYSLMPGIKVVALIDTHIFYSKENKNILLEKTAKASENNQLKKASGYLLTLLNRLNLSLEDMEKKDRDKRLGIDTQTNLTWMDKVLEFCRNHGLSSTPRKDVADMLVEAIKKGFPKHNYLIITTDMVDKRHRLYKVFMEFGCVIDCSVPKGERKADKTRQESVLNEHMQAILSREGKTIRKDAYLEMLNMVGFNLRTFSNDLDKLINFVGNRQEITIEDVRAVIKRTRTDPIFEFTNAVMDRNLISALYYLSVMLEAELHPLQLIAAMTNQIRKLLNMKGFVESPQGCVWQKGSQYHYFQNQVLPSLIKYDELLSEQLSRWENYFVKTDQKSNHKKGNGGKNAPVSDLYLAKNPKNPYPIYQTLKKSDNFSLKELKSAMNCLFQADIGLKSTGQSPRRILENVLFKICTADH